MKKINKNNKNTIDSVIPKNNKKPAKKLERVIAIILFCLCAFWTIASCLAVYSCFKVQKVSADNEIQGTEFYGSNFLIPTISVDLNNESSSVYFQPISLSQKYLNVYKTFDNQWTFTYGSLNDRFSSYSNPTITFNMLGEMSFYSTTSIADLSFLGLSNYTGTGYEFYRNIAVDNSLFSSSGYIADYNSITDNFTMRFNNTGWYFLYNQYHTSATFVYFLKSANDLGQLSYVEVFSTATPMAIDYYPVFNGTEYNDVLMIFTCIRYYDFDGNFVAFCLPNYFCRVDSLLFSQLGWDNGRFTNTDFANDLGLLNYRIYYLDDTNSVNLDSYYDDAWNSGYDVGFSNGRGQGFNEGVSSASNYTFYSLLSAVIDAPLTAISGLLNFNILGFNLLQLFYALITLAIIIFILRIILGNK